MTTDDRPPAPGRASSPLRRAAHSLYGAIPEGGLKHAVRVAGLSLRDRLTLRFYLNKGDVHVQVGTPSPMKVRDALAIVGPGGRVVVIEPEAANFAALAADPVLAAAPNVALVNKAAWCRRETLQFTVSKNKFDHKVAVPGVVHDNDLVPDNYVDTVPVEADTVDNILAGLKVDRPDLVEIHVNGAELEVLKGMDRILSGPVRLHLKGHAKVGDAGEPINAAIVEYLARRGFRTKVARPSEARREAEGWGKRAGDVYAAR